MTIKQKLLQSNKLKLIFNPFILFTKLSYRPKKVLRNIFSLPNSFDSIEILKDKLNGPNIISISDNTKFNNPLIFCLEKGSIITDNVNSDCFITRNQELISEITFSYKKGKKVDTVDNNIFQRYFLVPQEKYINGGVFSFLSGGGASTNYYHWLFDTLPRLKILMESPFKDLVGAYVVPGIKQKYKLDTLSFLDIYENQLIDSTIYSNIKADYIIATTHPNSPTLETIPNWICEFLRTHFMDSTHLKGERKIFVSRNKAPKRRILNEDLLFQRLKKLNFEKIYLEDLSFRDQVKIFSESNIIISAHGAGLANLVFSHPNTQVIEIFPPNSESDIYKNISINQSLRYFSYTAKTNSIPSNEVDLHADFIVDIDELLNLI